MNVVNTLSHNIYSIDIEREFMKEKKNNKHVHIVLKYSKINRTSGIILNTLVPR
jgi:hypothetical protein